MLWLLTTLENRFDGAESFTDRSELVSRVCPTHQRPNVGRGRAAHCTAGQAIGARVKSHKERDQQHNGRHGNKGEIVLTLWGSSQAAMCRLQVCGVQPTVYNDVARDADSSAVCVYGLCDRH